MRANGDLITAATAAPATAAGSISVLLLCAAAVVLLLVRKAAANTTAADDGIRPHETARIFAEMRIFISSEVAHINYSVFFGD